MPGRAVAVVLPAEESFCYGAEIQQTDPSRRRIPPVEGGMARRRERSAGSTTPAPAT